MKINICCGIRSQLILTQLKQSFFSHFRSIFYSIDNSHHLFCLNICMYDIYDAFCL